MKNKVAKLVTELGGKSKYSGKINTMFLTTTKMTIAQLKGHIYNKFGKLSFKLV